jgi:DNA-3-methyladenine glycosylase II
MRKAVSHLKKNDPVLCGIIERVGPYRMEYIEPTFESLVRAIVFQQLSGRVARVIFGRLREVNPDGQITPAGILRLELAQLRALGLSKQKIAYIHDLARRTTLGDLVFEKLPGLDDETVIEVLTQVKGIGVWTAHMFLIFALRRLDVLPTGDLGIRTAIRKAYEFPELPKPLEIEALARRWRPYRTVASWYLWRSLEAQAGL